MTNSISAIELTWTTLCAIGLYYAQKLLARAGGDFTSLRKRKINSIREYAALTTVLLYSAITIVQFLFVLIGIVSMMIVNRPSTSAGQMMVATSFLLVSAMLDVALFVVEKRREALVKKIMEIEGGMDVGPVSR